MKMAKPGEKGCGRGCDKWQEASGCKGWGYCHHAKARNTRAGEVTVSVRFLPANHSCLIPGS